MNRGQFPDDPDDPMTRYTDDPIADTTKDAAQQLESYELCSLSSDPVRLQSDRLKET